VIASQGIGTVSGSAARPIQTDLIKAVAVFRNPRMPALPQVPTAAEQRLNFGFDLVRPVRADGHAGGEKYTTRRSGGCNRPQCRRRSLGTRLYVPSEHRSTAYFQSIIGPEIGKNAAPLKAAGISVD
jgi:hypothetical protein